MCIGKNTNATALNVVQGKNACGHAYHALPAG
jgi:hypothetical protein